MRIVSESGDDSISPTVAQLGDTVEQQLRNNITYSENPAFAIIGHK